MEGAVIGVVRVAPGSAAAAAGVLSGDRIVAWRGPRPGDRRARSILDWWWAEREEAPRGAVILELERQGRTVEATLPWDDWGLTVRPVLSSPLQGKVGPALSWKAGRPLEPVREAVEALLDAGAQDTAAWFLETRAGKICRDDAGRAMVRAALKRLRNFQATEGSWRRSVVLGFVEATLLEASGRTTEAAARYRSMAGELKPGARAPVLMARALAAAARLERMQGRTRKAVDLFRTALDALEESAPESLLRASLLGRLGHLELELGDLRGAGLHIEAAAGLAQALAPESLVAASILGQQAQLAFQRGQLERAGTLYRRQLELRRKLAASPEVLASTLQNLGVVAAASRRLDRAQAYFEKALAIEEARDPRSMDTATILGNVAVVAQYRGDLRRSEELLRRSLEIYDARAPRGIDVVPILINLGKLAAEQGDDAAAEAYYDRGLSITADSAPGSDLEATLLVNLGWLHERRGEIQSALRVGARALEVLESAGSPPLRLAEARENLGRLWLEAGRPGKAGPLVLASLEIRRKVAPGTLDEAKSWDALALLAQARGHTAKAVQRLGKAERLALASGPGTWEQAEISHDLALLLHRRGAFEDAIDAGYRSIEAIERQVGRLGATTAIRARFRSRYLPWFRQLEEWLLAAGRVAEAYHVLERGRARSFVALLAERDLVPEGGVEADLDSRRRKLADAYDAVLAKLATVPPAEKRGLRRRLEELLQEMARLEEEVRRRDPRLAHMRYPEPLTAARAAATLEPGTAALVYSAGEHETLVFVLSRETPVRGFRIPLGRKELGERVALLRGLLTKPARDAAVRASIRQAGAALYQLLVAPAEPVIRRARRLLLVPDGPLQTLPFAALVRRDGRFLVERWALRSALSLTALAEIRSAGAGRSSGPLVAFGDPRPMPEPRGLGMTALRRGTRFAPLPGACRELRRIAKLVPVESRIFSKSDATEEAVFREAPQAGILHFATHVAVDDRFPLNSAIVLGCGAGHGNGILQAWEILERLHLDARLVVLSGCETGLGTSLDGEGLVGLTRSFELAGARAVLHTLWQVEDRVQEELMVRIYRGIAAGLPLDEAVRSAQLAFLRGEVSIPASGGGTVERILRFYRLASRPTITVTEPFYWAGICLEGERNNP